jgi:WD40 repeat protein
LSAALDYLVDRRGRRAQFGAFVVAASFDRAGESAALALGDGTLRLFELGGESWASVEAHRGAILSLAANAAPRGFITGGDDGRLMRTIQGAAPAEIANFGRRWVEHVASAEAGTIACAEGKNLHLFDADGHTLKTLAHPSTIGGIAFDARGKRVVATHYNGCTLWFVAAKTDSPRRLEWKGSHLAVAFHPEGEAVVTAMQENALHGWRLADGQDMRMSGYPAKTHSLSFSRTGKWLATSGADAIVLWPFFGGGPMGKAPMEIAGGANVLVTAVACHPKQDVVAAGFADGMVILADIATQRILPVTPGGGAPVSALAWHPTGAFLATGCEDGAAALIDLTTKG